MWKSDALLSDHWTPIPLLASLLPSWPGSRSPSSTDLALCSWLSVAKHQTESWILRRLAWQPWFLPSPFPSSISKYITLCCSYFLIHLSYPLDCEILKDKGHVLFIFVSLTVLSRMPGQKRSQWMWAKRMSLSTFCVVSPVRTPRVFLFCLQPLLSSCGLRQKG